MAPTTKTKTTSLEAQEDTSILHRLPTEIMWEIYEHLESPRDLSALSSTSKSLRNSVYGGYKAYLYKNVKPALRSALAATVLYPGGSEDEKESKCEACKREAVANAGASEDQQLIDGLQGLMIRQEQPQQQQQQEEEGQERSSDPISLFWKQYNEGTLELPDTLPLQKWAYLFRLWRAIELMVHGKSIDEDEDDDEERARWGPASGELWPMLRDVVQVWMVDHAREVIRGVVGLEDDDDVLRFLFLSFELHRKRIDNGAAEDRERQGLGNTDAVHGIVSLPRRPGMHGASLAFYFVWLFAQAVAVDAGSRAAGKRSIPCRVIVDRIWRHGLTCLHTLAVCEPERRRPELEPLRGKGHSCRRQGAKCKGPALPYTLALDCYYSPPEVFETILDHFLYQSDVGGDFIRWYNEDSSLATSPGY